MSFLLAVRYSIGETSEPVGQRRFVCQMELMPRSKHPLDPLAEKGGKTSEISPLSGKIAFLSLSFSLPHHPLSLPVSH